MYNPCKNYVNNKRFQYILAKFIIYKKEDSFCGCISGEYKDGGACAGTQCNECCISRKNRKNLLKYFPNVKF